jgi:PAS domain-containing protein
MINLLSHHIDAGQQRIAKLKQLNCVDQRLLGLAIQELTDSLEEALTIQKRFMAERERTAHEYDQIRDERLHYFEFFETAPHAFVTTSRTGLIVEANKACRSLLNFEKGFLIGFPLRGFVGREERTIFDEFVRDSIENRTATRSWFHVFPHNQPAFAAAFTVCPFGEDQQLGWTITVTADEKLHGPWQRSEEKQCFEHWLSGKQVRWIAESLGVPQTRALDWVTEWERGIQRKWQPYIPDLG